MRDLRRKVLDKFRFVLHKVSTVEARQVLCSVFHFQVAVHTIRMQIIDAGENVLQRINVAENAVRCIVK